MPGIAGIISKSGVAQSDIDRMTRVMLHEPHYVSGAYVSPENGVGVGWVSHEGAFCAGMPVWNDRHDVCLILTGEDFMDPDELKQRVAGPIDQSNPRYLLSLYDAMGTRFVERMNGWFSGVLIDLRRGNIVLFNDRFGLSRIYVHETAGAFYFSSEAKSLLEILPETRALDPAGVADTLACGSSLQGRTLFSGISLLPCGALWSFAPDGTRRKETYFQPKVWEQQPKLTEADFCDQLVDTFSRVLPKYMGGAQPVAMSLTGGLDGRMVMAWNGKSPGTLPCYTFGGTYRDCADVKLARQIAAICHQTHRTIPVGTEFMAEFPSLAEKAVLISDGAMDVTGSVELYVNRMARGIAPVRLTGNYGSEIVRSNIAFRPGRPWMPMLTPDFGERVRASGEAYRIERNVSPLSFIAFKQVPWHHYARLAVEQSQLTLRSPFLDNELVALMFRAPAGAAENSAPTLRLIHDGNPRLARLPTDRGLSSEPPSAFGKVRQKLIDLTVKAEYAYDYGMPQRLAAIDNVLSPLHLEKLFLGRHKFYHFRVWYRDQLAGYLKDVLLDPRSLRRDYLNGPELERMVLAHTSGRENWTKEIHRALTLELLQRQLIDRR